jgi:hypothetical protein
MAALSPKLQCKFRILDLGFWIGGIASLYPLIKKIKNIKNMRSIK